MDEEVELKRGGRQQHSPPASPRSSRSTRTKANDYMLRCCSGSTTDKRVLDFTGKFVVGLLVLLFSMYGILTIPSDCSPLLALYSSLITLVVGVFVGERRENNTGS